MAQEKAEKGVDDSFLAHLQALLTSDAGPLSAPGQEKVTNSWQRLWTTKQHTEVERKREVH